MTNEQINRAIAEACGWTDFSEHPDWGTMAIEPETHRFRTMIPSYTTDLNWMHEAEKVLNSWEDYVSYQSWLGYCGGSVITQLQQCITATARQRAEAFLRTLGKWEEVQP